MHIAKSAEVNLYDDPENPKLVYLGDILEESRRAKGTKLLRNYVKVFTYGYINM